MRPSLENVLFHEKLLLEKRERRFFCELRGDFGVDLLELLLLVRNLLLSVGDLCHLVYTPSDPICDFFQVDIVFLPPLLRSVLPPLLSQPFLVLE